MYQVNVAFRGYICRYFINTSDRAYALKITTACFRQDFPGKNISSIVATYIGDFIAILTQEGAVEYTRTIPQLKLEEGLPK
jgi:hypothetical protein